MAGSSCGGRCFGPEGVHGLPSPSWYAIAAAAPFFHLCIFVPLPLLLLVFVMRVQDLWAVTVAPPTVHGAEPGDRGVGEGGFGDRGVGEGGFGCRGVGEGGFGDRGVAEGGFGYRGVGEGDSPHQSSVHDPLLAYWLGAEPEISLDLFRPNFFTLLQQRASGGGLYLPPLERPKNHTVE